MSPSRRTTSVIGPATPSASTSKETLGHTWFYTDGVGARRCRTCYRPADAHDPQCVLGRAVQIVRDWRDDDDADSMQVLCWLMDLFGIPSEDQETPCEKS